MPDTFTSQGTPVDLKLWWEYSTSSKLPTYDLYFRSVVRGESFLFKGALTGIRMQPVRMDDPLFPKAWHGEEQNYTGDTHEKEKAGQENIRSRVGGIQNIAGTQKACMLAGSWHYICASREVCEKLGFFSCFSSLLIGRAFIMLTLWSLPSEKLPKECIWNYPVNFVLCCQHILFELHAWTCLFLNITLSIFFLLLCNSAAASEKQQKEPFGLDTYECLFQSQGGRKSVIGHSDSV